MDDCTYAGHHWAVADISGKWPVPTSASLGFETMGRYTGDITGRVDEFDLDEDGVLRLARIHAQFRALSDDVTPPGARREPMEHRSEGETTFRFEDLRIPFTGTLVLGRELNKDLYVHMGTQTPNRFEHRAILRFEEGRLIEERLEEGSTPDPPLPVGEETLSWLPCSALLLLAVGAALAFWWLVTA